MNPVGRVPVSVPRDVWTLPSYYHNKDTARWRVYADTPWKPLYSFGYGLRLYEFLMLGNIGRGEVVPRAIHLQAGIPYITFSTDIQNTGQREGSYVLQVYLLGRVSSVTTSAKQLVAFQRVYLDAGEKRRVRMELEVERYLPVLDRE